MPWDTWNKGAFPLVTSSTIDLSGVIVNYNGKPWLENCLNSLMEQANNLAYEIIVIDNASHDESVAILQRQFPWVKLIRNPSNVGFARANNQGIEIAQGKYVLLLNNDTVFERGLPEMIDFLRRHPLCAAVGPQMLDGDGNPRASWGYFPTLHRLATTMLLLDRLPLLGKHCQPLLVRPSRAEFFAPAHPVDWASGACLLIPRFVLNKVGMFNTSYFMYYEEVEWCYRAWKMGFEVWIYPFARLIHYGAGGQEWRHWKGVHPTLNAYRNFLHFGRLHYPSWQKIPLRLILFTGAMLRLLIGIGLYLFDKRAAKQAQQVMRAYAQVLKMVWKS